MKLVDYPEVIEGLRRPTTSEPWRILLSACMMGQRVGVDGTDYGMGTACPQWLKSARVQPFGFCPEAFAMGVPRTMPDIHGGDGFDVLDGAARVLDEHGRELTEETISGAEAMVEFATEYDVELAILTDISASCGTQVIFEGSRYEEPKTYQRGVGVAAALLIRDEIPVVSYRDLRTLESLRVKVEPNTSPDPDAIDHHETEWVRDYFELS